jgi:endonuclease/exonuclease/phosphatase family metal-dependent hydrolase
MRITRRDALVGGAGAAIGVGTPTVGSARAQDPTTPVTVATRNCYLGANLFRLLVAATEGAEAVRGAVSDLLRTVDRSHVPARLDAIAAEIGRTEPDLVGLQEVGLIRTGKPTDSTTPTATEVRYDFRETLTTALADRGLSYRVVAAVTTTDFQLPTTVDGERRAVRLTDRDLILAHEDVTTSEVTTGRFDAAVSLSSDGETISVERGYGVVDATVGDTRLTFCNTHLESVSAGTRLQQATEVASLLTERRDRVALVGDLNSGPGGSRGAYDRLRETFRDAADGVGHTCCHAATLRNDEVSLTARIDHVLVRGLGVTGATRVGDDPADRISAGDDRLWPSDHAGVVATLEPGAEPTTTRTATATEETASPTPTATPTSTTTAGSSVSVGSDTTVELPGFGAASAAVSVLAAALAARRRAEDD